MNENLIPFSIREIQKRVADYFDISLEEMRNDRRDRRIARPRQVAMHLSCRLTGHSNTVIAECFNRERSTVRHANIEIPSLMMQEPLLADNVRALKKELANVDKKGEELSVELAIDILVTSLTARLRGQLEAMANSNPIALVEMIKSLDPPSKRTPS